MHVAVTVPIVSLNSTRVEPLIFKGTGGHADRFSVHRPFKISFASTNKGEEIFLFCIATSNRYCKPTSFCLVNFSH